MSRTACATAEGEPRIAEPTAPQTCRIASDSQPVLTLPAEANEGQQAASLCFWIQPKGQALIECFEDTPEAPGLANWLAMTYPNLHGPRGGAYNLTGKTGVEVASLIKRLARNPGRNVEAQILTTALNVYATTRSLGGDLAVVAGFLVTEEGLGVVSRSVRRHGVAFGVPDHTVCRVDQLLHFINSQTDGGVVYRDRNNLRFHTLVVFDSINQSLEHSGVPADSSRA